VQLVLADRDADPPDPQHNFTEFIQETNLAWEAFAHMWAVRLGAAPMGSGFGQQLVGRLKAGVAPDAWNTSFDQTPPMVAWIYHSLDVDAMDSEFLRNWYRNKKPAIIVNVRDLRDAVVSMANFARSSVGRDMLKVPDAPLFFPAIAHLGDLAYGIDRMLANPSFPLFRDYERAITFYMHPDVLAVRFEDLVGARGRGSVDSQVDTVEKVASFLGIGCADPAAVADGLFNANSFTFHRGMIGGWREVLNNRQLAEIEKKYGYILSALDYSD
jgi:hypothetical protein